MGGLKINADGTTEASTKEVSGYSVTQAENMDEARRLIEGHPHKNIEVHESVSILAVFNHNGATNATLQYIKEYF